MAAIQITFRRIVLVLGAMILLLVGWVVFSLFGPAPAIVVSKETTYLTEPLGDDGLPDYGQAILQRQREGVTAENNGAIPFWQAMWPGDLSPEFRAPLLKELGMSEPETGLSDPYRDSQLRRELIYLLLKEHGHEEIAEKFREEAHDEDVGTLGFGPDGFYSGDADSPVGQAEEEADRLLANLAQPWTAQQIPPLAEWMEKNERLLDLLVEAGNRPKFYSPSPSLINGQDVSLMAILLPSLQTVRQAVRMLSKRALLRMANGQHDDAWHDLQSCYGLADHLSGQHTLIHELVSIACAGITHEATLHLLDRPDLPVELAREILREFKARAPRRAIADVYHDGERLMVLDTIIRFSQGEMGALDVGDTSRFAAFSFDWNLILRNGNKWFDRFAEAARLEVWEERQADFGQINGELSALRTTSGQIIFGTLSRKSLGNTFIALLLPAIEIAVAAEDRDNTRLDMMRLAATLAVFRAEHGDYPDSLDALVPGVLEKLPVDLFHQNPFVYQKTENGYLLYSLGPNGQDDGGSSDKLRCYKGYQIEQYNEAVLRELLGEPAPPEDSVESRSGFQTDDNQLSELIPFGADDHSLRLPLPVIPLPSLEE